MPSHSVPSIPKSSQESGSWRGRNVLRNARGAGRPENKAILDALPGCLEFDFEAEGYFLEFVDSVSKLVGLAHSCILSEFGSSGETW